MSSAIVPAEAEYAGPWTVRPHQSGFAVLREVDDEHGLPSALLRERETALLVAAVLPVLGREPRYQLNWKDGACGVDLCTLGDRRLERVGWLRHSHPGLLEALHLAEWLLRSPASLALLLEAASYEVLVHAGRILDRRLSTEEPSAAEVDAGADGGRPGSHPYVHGSMRVREVMRTGVDVPRVETSTTLGETIAAMAQGKLGITAVTDAEGHLVGHLSVDDLRRLTNDPTVSLDGPVGEHSRPSPPVIDADSSALAALERMAHDTVTSLFVCDAEGRLKGIVHVYDLWRTEIRQG